MLEHKATGPFYASHIRLCSSYTQKRKLPTDSFKRKLKQRLYLELLPILKPHCSTKSPQANTAAHASLPSQSIQSFPISTLPKSYAFLLILSYGLLPTHSGITYFLFDLRWMAEIDDLWQYVSPTKRHKIEIHIKTKINPKLNPSIFEFPQHKERGID